MGVTFVTPPTAFSLSAIPDKRRRVKKTFTPHAIENPMQFKRSFIFFHKNTQSGFFEIVRFRTPGVDYPLNGYLPEFRNGGRKSPSIVRIRTNKLVRFLGGLQIIENHI
jgi:hypothetical protein